MRIVVPAQAVVAKRQQRDDAHDTEHHDGKPVEDAAGRDFTGRERGDGRCEGHGRSAQVFNGGGLFAAYWAGPPPPRRPPPPPAPWPPAAPAPRPLAPPQNDPPHPRS